MRKVSLCFVMLLCCLLVIACGDETTATPVPAPTATIPAATQTIPAAPTATATVIPPTITATPRPPTATPDFNATAGAAVTAQFQQKATEGANSTARAVQDAATVNALGAQATLTARAAPTATPRIIPTAVPQPTVNISSIGIEGHVGTWAVTVIGITKPGKNMVWSDYGNKTTAAGEWLILEVAIRNNGKSSANLQTDNFGIKDTDNNTYFADFYGNAYSEYKGGLYITKAVPPGVTNRSYLAFDVKPGLVDPYMIFLLDSDNYWLYPLVKA
jgi:hypothetical protein